MNTASRRSIDVIAFERWIQSIPSRIDVMAWQHDGLAIWPLFKTILIGLGILARIEQPKRGMPTGGLGWRAGVMADYFALSGLRKTRSRRLPQLAPAEGLSGAVVYYASGGHGRDLGELYLTPSLDVPAALLGRAGRRCVFWYEDLEADAPSLSRTLHSPSYGLSNMLADARGRSMRFGTRDALGVLPGFVECCEAAAGHLKLKPRFLQLWFARQVNLAIAVAQTFDQVLARDGRPELLVILNSCVWSTTGLVAAARRHHVPVVEVHHGAESQSAVTAPGERPHFSTFNTAPDALIAWDCRSRDDDRVFSAGPLGLQLAAIVPERTTDERQTYAMLRQMMARQRDALARRAQDTRRAGEILVTLQPGDDGRWIVEAARELSIDVLLWVRMHALDSARVLAAVPAHLASRMDAALGSSTLLPLLLERADVHLTRFSGVTLEAAAMGVPTVATEAYAGDLYGRQLPQDALYVETSPRAIAERLQSLIAGRAERHVSRLPDLGGLVPFVERFAQAKGMAS